MLRPTAALLCLWAIFSPSYAIALPQAVIPGSDSGVDVPTPTPTASSTRTPLARARVTTSPTTTSTSGTSTRTNRGIRTYVSNGTTYQEPIADPTAAPDDGTLGPIGPAAGDARTDVVPETNPVAVGSFQTSLAKAPPTSTYTTPETINPSAATTTEEDQAPAITLAGIRPPPPVVKREMEVEIEKGGYEVEFEKKEGEIEVEVEANDLEVEVEADTASLVSRDPGNGTEGYFDDGYQTHDLEKRQTVSNIFTSIGTGSPPAVFARRVGHPVVRQGVMDTGRPIQTNKFYSNFFLGTRNNPTFTLPYEIWWSKEPDSPWGLSFDHRDPEDIVFGDPKPPVNAREWYSNPVWIRSLSFSAKEFVTGTSTLEMAKLTAFSAELTMYSNKATSTTKKLVSPICQGMAFVSGVYTGLTPAFDSNVFFRRIVQLPFAANANVRKIRIYLEDNSVWLLYAWPASGSLPLVMNLVSTTRMEATTIFSGMIQVGKVSNTGGTNTAAESVYDAHAGSICTGLTLSGSVSGSTGNYRFTYTKTTLSNSPLLMFALPHHTKSFDSTTAGRARTALRLTSSSKGRMTAISSDTWNMVESGLPTNVGWMPVKSGSPAVFAAGHLTKLAAEARSNIAEDMSANTNLDSMYFSGKAMAKYAYVCLAASEVLKDSTLTVNCLNKLKTAFDRFASNRQINPLVYESSRWRGLVSSAMYTTGDPMADFGSGYYNDHHFHYGYFVQAGAIIAFLDKKWATGSWHSVKNKDFVNNLVRDVANPSTSDGFYPVFRSFDWFHGHSWAKGLFPSLDGKDEESSSEDYNFYYAMKLWGNVIGDKAMEARGNLMLAILKRSINEYMLIGQGKNNHPSSFEGNLVTGILWENKAHHTTWFSTAAEAIHGIHMLPLTPISPYMRSSAFCNKEWDQYWSNSRINSVTDGWRGIIMANVAIFSPTTSFTFFNQANFPRAYLDGGASKTWYLAFAGSLGGAAM